VLHPEEVAQSRFSSGYSLDTTLEDAYHKGFSNAK